MMSFALLGIQEISAAKLISSISLLGFKKKGGGVVASQRRDISLLLSVSVLTFEPQNCK